MKIGVLSCLKEQMILIVVLLFKIDEIIEIRCTIVFFFVEHR